MAETIATGYIQLMPSTKGMKAAIESELKGSVAAPLAAEAKTASAQVSQSLVTAVQRDAAPAMGKAVATSLQASAKTASVGIIAQLKATVAQFGGTGAVVQGLSTNASTATQRLSGLVQGSAQLSSASGGLKGSLLGVSGLLGGPWGVAIAGAGLAINGFVQAQQAAKDASDALRNSFDATTGKFTANSTKLIAEQLTNDLNKPGDLERLRAMNIDLAQSVIALANGGGALDQYIASLEKQRDAMAVTTGATRGHAGAINLDRVAIDGLISSLVHQRNDVNSATSAFQLGAAATDIATRATQGLGGMTSKTSAAIRAQTALLGSSQAASATYAGGLASIAAQGAAVEKHIKAIPKSVTVTAQSVGLDAIAAKANAAAAAILAMTAALDQRTSGGDANTGASRVAAARAAALRAAAARATAAAAAAMRTHNASVTARVSGGGSGGGGGTSAAASAARTARQALRDQVTDSNFVTSLTSGSAKEIAKITASLSKGAAAVLKGRTETAITRLLRTDTTKLQALATQRDGIAKRLSSAQQSLDNLAQTKASTASQTATAAMGNLVGARSSSGVLRVLNRQLSAVTTFRSNLTALAKRGLPKAFLSQLVAAGLDGATTAAALMRSNDSDFANITALTNQLSSEASGLGNDAGNLLYNDGIAAAQGLIRGLKSQQSAVEAQMLVIAKAMQNAIKRALGIRSPSTVFAALGEQIPAGLGVGIDKGTPGVHRKVASMVPTNTGYKMTSPSAGYAGGGVHAPITITGRDPVEAAHLVANEIAWRAKR